MLGITQRAFQAPNKELILVQCGVERSRSAAERAERREPYSLVTPSFRWCFTGECIMSPSERQRFDELYQQHQTQLKLQGKRPKTISAYSLAVRRITKYFDRCPDKLTIEDLRRYFSQLIGQVSWSTIKLDRCGLQFFYKHTLNKQWEWIGIIKPPKVKRLPNIISPEQVAQVINATRETRYQVLF